MTGAGHRLLSPFTLNPAYERDVITGTSGEIISHPQSVFFFYNEEQSVSFMILGGFGVHKCIIDKFALLWGEAQLCLTYVC